MWPQNFGSLELIRAATITTSSASPSRYVDITNYAALAKRPVKVVIQVGTLSTTATCTFNITECATTNGTYAAPANGTTQKVITAAGIYEVAVRCDNPYVRLEYSVDATGSVPVAASLQALKRDANS